MVRTVIVTIVAALGLTGMMQARGVGTGQFTRLVQAIKTAAPELKVELDRGNATHATCHEGNAAVDLRMDDLGRLTISAAVLDAGYRTGAIEREISNTNDHLDVGTLWWDVQGGLVLVHRIAVAEENISAAADVVKRMVARAGALRDMFRSIARS